MLRKKNSPKIDPEQRELIERAQERAKQKKRLYQHFIVFLIGSVVLILLNLFFEIGLNIDPFGIAWSIWAIGFWFLLLLAHMFNVFITNRFLGKTWENQQIERLVARQQERIAALQKKVDKQHPLPKGDEPLITPTSEKPVRPDNNQ